MAAAHILVVDDEVDMAETCHKILTRQGHRVATAYSPEAAERLLAENQFDLLIADLVMPGKDGLALARHARERDPGLAVLIITAHATIDSALRATREGAFDYIPKPFTMEQLEVAVERGLEARRLRETSETTRRRDEARVDFSRIVGQSLAMKETLDVVRRIADSEANVLIVGESGTGKEVVARAIHLNSRRRQRAFVPLDCAAVPEALLESELFGAERGAFTGADVARSGLMEAASGGTIFLDEISNLPVTMQVKLLRVLQERRVRRLGGTREVPVDVRLLAASNQDLRALVRAGRFREDLYYRLNVVQIKMPPLRERAGDIRLLAEHFATDVAAHHGKTVRGISSAALMLLERHDWPGNVRELRNVIERAVSLTESNQVMPADLPPHLTGSAGPPVTGDTFMCARRRVVMEFERAYLRALLEECSGNVSRAAERAGLKRTALHRLLARHRLEADDFRRPAATLRPGAEPGTAGPRSRDAL